MKKIRFIIIFSLSYLSLCAQLAGIYPYEFLRLNIPARANALGGTSMAIWDNDINLANGNPAAINSGMHKQLTFNHVNFVSDLKYGQFGYAHKLKKMGTLSYGLQYFSYGKFDGRDEYDEETGNFKASDYVFNIAIGKPINKDSSLNIGVALKTIYTQYDIYKSIGNAIDVGLTYHNKKNFVVSLLAKNYGRQWRTFNYVNTQNKLPFDIQIGISKKVAKAPFRVLVVYDELLNWNLNYTSPLSENISNDPFSNEQQVKTEKEIRKEKRQESIGKFAKHLTFGTEILLTKNFNIRLGYNYRKSSEMALPERRVINGFSAGFSMKISKFHFNYAYSKFALNGNSHTFGVTTNLNYFNKP